MGLTRKAFHENTWFEYSYLRTVMGGRPFHMYQLITETSPQEEIDRVKAFLQNLKWKGLLIVQREKARVCVRGTTRYLNVYQLI